MKISFAKNGNWREKLRLAFMLRFDAKADYLQEEDCVADPLDDRFGCAYAYVGTLTHDTYESGTQIGLRCSFEGYGAPMLTLAEEMALDKDGDAHYGGCIEIVIWKHGMNVWRHIRENDCMTYHHIMGIFTPLEEGVIHELRVKVDGKMLLTDIDGKRFSVRIEDMPEKFWVGAALCEGENRLYDLQINENDSFGDFMTWADTTVPVQKFDC